jgi:hypothetical protein
VSARYLAYITVIPFGLAAVLKAGVDESLWPLVMLPVAGLVWLVLVLTRSV